MKKSANKKPASGEKTETAPRPKFHFGKFIATHTLLLGGILVLLVLVAGTGVLAAENQYKQKFFPGVKIGTVSVAGLTYTQALDKISPDLLALEEQGLTFQSGDTSVVVPATLIPVDPGADEISIFSVDPDSTVEVAFSIGRRGNFISQLGEQIAVALAGASVPVQYTLDETVLETQLTDTFSPLEQPAQDASLTYEAEKDHWSIISAAAGSTFDYAAVVAVARSRFEQASTEPIELTLQTEQPQVSDHAAWDLLKDAYQLLKLAPLTVHVEDKAFEVGKEELAGWVDATPFGIGLNPEAVSSSLKIMAEQVDQPAKEGRFRFVDGTIEQFEGSQDGKRLDVLTSVGLLQTQIVGQKKSDITVYVAVDKPAVTPENIGDLGIKELLGTGHSNKSGSPYNRQLNISRGAELLNGILIAPGEEFSVLDHLRPFTLDNGYYPELVIKDNKTIPEIGGGLCQIGTTTFRMAMNTGLPILERRNHSYAVSYYFDDANHLPGTDATIYDPAPDMKFTNDTGHWMLFEAKIDGLDLYFSLYGTSDGRHGYFTPPSISGWVSPPPTKEIEDASIPAGTQKCTERAHPGTTANFDYIIEYADGTSTTRTFTSVYKPWQAVCLVPPKTTEAAPAADTSTDSPADTTTDTTPTTDNNSDSNSNVNSSEPETSAPVTDAKPKKKKN